MIIERNRLMDVFVRLGEEWENPESAPDWAEAVAVAEADNGWFSAEEIVRAARALSEAMLTRKRLGEWLAAYPERTGEAPLVCVVMAGNIPLAGFFDLACVLFSGARCLCKPSGKDRTMMGYVVRRLLTIEPELPLGFTDGEGTYDAVIASGSDNTNRYFRARYGTVPALLRGSRSSLAVLNGSESVADLHGLADDIFTYGGLGCRSVSLLWVPRGYDVRRLASVWSARPVGTKYRNSYRQARALLVMQGLPHVDGGNFVLAPGDGFPDAPGRIAYRFYDTAAEVGQWIADHDGEIQCVVCGRDTFDGPRRVEWGRAQYPAPWDYPDGVDTMDFLGGIVAGKV